MKGLVYKELYLGRKTFFSFLTLTVVFTILGILVCLSMICGNLQELAKDPMQVKLFYEMFTYLPPVLLMFSLSGSNQSIYSDYASDWMYYSYTLPTKAVKTVGARYLSGIIVIGFGIVYGSLNALVIGALTDVSITAEVFKNMLVIVIVTILIYSILIPMAFKYKNARAVSTRVTITVVILYVTFGAFYVRKMLSSGVNGESETQFAEMMMEKYKTIRDLLLPFSPIIILGILGISLALSVKIYQRREK